MFTYLKHCAKIFVLSHLILKWPNEKDSIIIPILQWKKELRHVQVQ